MNKSNFIKVIGIGAFLFLSILELTILIEETLIQLQIILTANASIEVQWFPEFIGLLIFSVLTFWTLRYTEKLVQMQRKRLLIISILVFFGILLLQFIQPLVTTQYILRNYLDAFSHFYENRNTYSNQMIIGILDIVKYAVFALAVYLKK